MNKSIIHNFIMIAIIPIIMFLGLSLRSYASGVANNTFQIRHSNTSYNDNYHNCTINLSGNPNFSIGKETNSTSYQGDTIYATLKVTTSEGTFDIKSSTTYISSSTSSSNLGFNDLGSITLPGYFINLYVDYSSGIYKSGDLIATEYGQVTSSSMYTTYSGDINGRMVPTYDMARISSIGNSSYGSYTNGTYSVDNSSLIPYYFDYGLINTLWYSNYNYTYQITGHNLTFNVSDISDQGWSFSYCYLFDNGNVGIVYNGSYDSSTSRVHVYIPTYVYTSKPIKSFIIVNGLLSPNVTYSQVRLDIVRTPCDPLNVIDTRDQSDWQTIEDSEELDNFSKTSVSMNEIISDNNDTFNNDFSDYNSNISSVNLTGSSTDANRLTTVTRFLFNGFYQGLNDNFKKYIRIVLNIGLAMMVLTVGTRVVAHKGWLNG